MRKSGHHEGTNRIDRICMNPILMNTVVIQDERDAVGKKKAVDKIIKYDHHLAAYSKYKPAPVIDQQLD